MMFSLVNNVLLLQLHTTEVDDGLDWNRINLKSVTEENTLDEFLSTAELAGTEFSAGRLEPAHFTFILSLYIHMIMNQVVH